MNAPVATTAYAVSSVGDLVVAIPADQVGSIDEVPAGASDLLDVAALLGQPSRAQRRRAARLAGRASLTLLVGARVDLVSVEAPEHLELPLLLAEHYRGLGVSGLLALTSGVACVLDPGLLARARRGPRSAGG